LTGRGCKLPPRLRSYLASLEYDGFAGQTTSRCRQRRSSASATRQCLACPAEFSQRNIALPAPFLAIPWIQIIADRCSPEPLLFCPGSSVHMDLLSRRAALCGSSRNDVRGTEAPASGLPSWQGRFPSASAARMDWRASLTKSSYQLQRRTHAPTGLGIIWKFAGLLSAALAGILNECVEILR